MAARYLNSILIVILMLLTSVAAAMKVTENHPAFDYDWNQSPGKPIVVREGDITYLSSGGVVLGDGAREIRGDLGFDTREGIASWTIVSEKPHNFQVRILASDLRKQTITIHGPRNAVTCDVYGRGRSQKTLEVPAGQHKIDIRNPARVFGVELVDVRDVPELEKRVHDFRGDQTWMAERTYGIMFQWGGWGYPEQGEKKPWPEMINDFNVERWADMMEEMGAGWVTWSVTWSTQHMPCPLRVREEICPGWNCQRDLLQDIADALYERDIKLFFYYHPGHSSSEFWKAYACDENGNVDRNKWYRNFIKIVTAMGNRYGTKLHGWGIDGGRKYYPCPFEQMGWALKAGNPDRIMDYNPWRLARLTEYVEISQGEHASPVKPHWFVDKNGIYTEGPFRGLIAGGCFLPERSGWGVKNPEWKIKDPIMSPGQWVRNLETARENHTTLTPCICMWENGKINRKTYDMFVNARRQFRGISDVELADIRSARGDDPNTCSYVWDN